VFSAASSTSWYSQLPPAGQYHPVGNSTHAVPNLLFGPFTDLNRIFMLFETVIQHVHHLSHLQSEPDTRKGVSQRFLGLENAQEPILGFPEPKIVVRDPHFCVSAYLLSKRTASEQLDSTQPASKPVSNAGINPKGYQSKRSSHIEG